MATNPDAWPDADLTGDPAIVIAAAAVQDIARALAAALAEEGWSLRGLAAASGVNRQAIADLLAGRSWPDVATVARLQHAVDQHLWPGHSPPSHGGRPTDPR